MAMRDAEGDARTGGGSFAPARRRFLGATLKAAGAILLAGLLPPRAGCQDSAPAGTVPAPRPRGLCFLPDGTLYVTGVAPAGYELLRVAANGSGAEPLLHSRGGSALNLPTQVVCFGDEGLAVVDTNRCRVCLFGPHGWRGRVIGGPGFTPGRFHYPGGLAAADRWLWVADTGNHRVQAVDPYGEARAVIGMLGDGPERFRRPRAVARLTDGTVLVLDEGHAAAKFFDEEGRWRRQIDLPGGGYARADALAVDEARGILCVALSGLRRVLVFGLDGAERGPGLSGIAGSALAFHPDGRLAVADTEAGRIAFFELRG